MVGRATDAVSQLTEAQRQVLRAFHARKSAKEIGRELGITHWAVNERLRAARRVLGVATSGEAARMLAAAEAEGTYNRVVYEPEPVAGAGAAVPSDGVGEDGRWPPRDAHGDVVREEQVPYRSLAAPGPRLPFPRFGGDRNDLTVRSRLAWIGAIAIFMVVVLGSLITISSGVVRLVAQVLRGLA